MRKHELEALNRAITLLLEVPLPHIGLGRESASTAGAVKYAHDMHRARGLFRAVREAVLFRDPPAEIRAALGEFEKWFEGRKREDWR